MPIFSRPPLPPPPIPTPIEKHAKCLCLVSSQVSKKKTPLVKNICLPPKPESKFGKIGFESKHHGRKTCYWVLISGQIRWRACSVVEFVRKSLKISTPTSLSGRPVHHFYGSCDLNFVRLHSHKSDGLGGEFHPPKPPKTSKTISKNHHLTTLHQAPNHQPTSTTPPKTLKSQHF